MKLMNFKLSRKEQKSVRFASISPEFKFRSQFNRSFVRLSVVAEGRIIYAHGNRRRKDAFDENIKSERKQRRSIKRKRKQKHYLQNIHKEIIIIRQILRTKNNLGNEDTNNSRNTLF